jgi:uncharacterized protein (DUF488 family)
MKDDAKRRTNASNSTSQQPLFQITGTSNQLIVWSIGHSDKEFSELLEKLLLNQIDRVVDVRTKPYSRRYPRFNREAMALSLAEADINYDFRGFSLGGLSPNVRYDETITELCQYAKTERIALLCSEASPAKCHRKQILQPDFEKAGVTVSHIYY